jgi:hypothetical protein
MPPKLAIPKFSPSKAKALVKLFPDRNLAEIAPSTGSVPVCRQGAREKRQERSEALLVDPPAVVGNSEYAHPVDFSSASIPSHKSQASLPSSSSNASAVSNPSNPSNALDASNALALHAIRRTRQTYQTRNTCQARQNLTCLPHADKACGCEYVSDRRTYRFRRRLPPSLTPLRHYFSPTS